MFIRFQVNKGPFGLDYPRNFLGVSLAEIAKAKPKEVFTSLYHYLNVEMLIQCHNELSADKAAGVDEVTKEEYSINLAGNILERVYKVDS